MSKSCVDAYSKYIFLCDFHEIVNSFIFPDRRKISYLLFLIAGDQKKTR